MLRKLTAPQPRPPGEVLHWSTRTATSASPSQKGDRSALRRLLNRLPGKEDIPMWKSFLLSIAALSVSMLCALYSTAVVRSGDMAIAVGSALLALAIAAWVGIRLVPRLASGVDWTWLPALNQIKITRDGHIFFGAVVVVLLAAINTSNNLLYMVLSALIAVVVLSGLLSAANFKNLGMELLLPPRAFANEKVTVSVRIRNPRRFLPGFSLLTEPPGTRFYFQVIPPKAVSVLSGETRFARRGRYGFETLQAASRYPFGFFSKIRQYSVRAECICYPEIHPEEDLELSIADILGSHPRWDRGMGNDLHSIRQYVSSDSARHVHWKASAKTASLKTREFASEDSRRFEIALDRFGNEQDAEAFEALVSEAASMAFHLNRNGVNATLVTDEWESPSEHSEGALDTILEYLAVVEMSAAAAPPNFDPRSGTLLFSLRYGRDGGDGRQGKPA